MRKLTTIGMMILMLGMSIPTMGAMSNSRMRKEARFLTDRMAYELGLNAMQYDDVYEVNYDFLNGVRYLMDDVVRGYGYAIDRYYNCLDVRNDDLHWILSDRQYHRFLQTEYFSRPIYTSGNKWLFRIYRVYTDVRHFYFGKPHHYATYKGHHHRDHHHGVSYYKTNRKEHYNHPVYQGPTKVDRRPGNKPGMGNQSHAGKVDRKHDNKGKPNVGHVNAAPVKSGKDRVDNRPARKETPASKKMERKPAKVGNSTAKDAPKVKREATKRTEVKAKENGRQSRNASSSRNATRSSEARRTARNK